jgi:hypothetical protein
MTLSYAHLVRLSDEVGILEHADHAVPRLEHGYCVDDVARALMVVSREPRPDAALRALGARFVQFISDAQAANGLVCNRRSFAGVWGGKPSAGDCWGRALWGLGTAAARSHDADLRAWARRRFEISASIRPGFRRPLAFAALGAAEILAVDPDHRAARALLASVPDMIGQPTGRRAWPWPETRLTYANAALPESLLAACELLGDDQALADGLELLDWLLGVETRGSHLSVTPAGGWSIGEPRPGFDQQPIEVASLADACARAMRLTGDPRWARGVAMAVAWFRGDNDVGVALIDPMTGGGCDGLGPSARNENQGAESTLAMLATLQLASSIESGQSRVAPEHPANGSRATIARI